MGEGTIVSLILFSAGNTDLVEINWKGTCFSTAAGLPSGVPQNMGCI